MESLSRISTLLETARDLTLEAAQSASITASARAPPTPSPTATKKLLNSRVDREVLDGLRKVISMMSLGTDCSPFFADVVKNVASPTLEIKKLVYIYLLRYAESEPDLALLSINTIQKALTDQSQLVRSMAIRVMAGIRVPVISQIVALGIKRCAADMSPYVRKAAAVAIPKCYRLDPGTLPALRECLTVLLADRSFYVVGAAVVAWEGVCPRSWEMLHGHYRALARMLIDMDEWGQLAVLRVLTGYARANFPAREQKVKKAAVKEAAGKAGGGDGDGDGFYSDEGGDEGVMRGRKGKVVAAAMDADLELLLRSCIPLLQSRNSAVIVAVARLYTHLAPASSLPTVAGPLISLLRAPTDIQHIALLNIVSIALKTPQPFTPYATHFLVHASDPPHIWKLKLELLTLIFPHTPARTKNLILGELEYFAHTPDPTLVREAVRAIGRCAQSETRNAARCLKLLMRQVESGTTGTLVAESLTVIRHIILQNPAAHAHTVVRLAKALDTAVNPSARASIIWLVGEFAGANGGDNVAADTLRLLAKTFVLEGEAAKLQIVLLAAKVYAHHLDRTQSGSPPPPPPEDGAEDGGGGEKHPVALLFGYITLLARYDQSYDLRDRARLYKSILSTPSSTPLATLLLLAPKPTPLAPSPSCGREKYTVGSAAMVVGGDEDVSGYEPLEDWVGRSRAPSPSVRDVAAVDGEMERRGGAAVAVSRKTVAAAAGGGGGASPGMAATPERSPVWRPEGVKAQQVKEVPETLEDFFKESEEEEEEASGEETEEEETEEESEEESGEEEEEDDEEEEEEEESEDEGNEGSKLLTQDK